jgi:uncharacterized repeat protein (TIGR03803 family)
MPSRKSLFHLCGRLAAFAASFIMASSALSAAQTETVLYRFGGGKYGQLPLGLLVADASGNLYGTTFECGAVCSGVVFEVASPTSGHHTEIVLYSFSGEGDGGNPGAGLVFDAAGNLYGTTNSGGQYRYGTVFELSPPSSQGQAWTETVLYSFQGGSDGANPNSNLMFDADGNLYGNTVNGGGNSCALADECGTVFRLSPPAIPGGAWTETVLHAFGASSDDGWDPSGALVFDKKGALYGTTFNGGLGDESCSDGCGTVYKLTPPAISGDPWKETALWRPEDSSNGNGPAGSLVFGNDGKNLYGTTETGGSTGYGTVFELSPSFGGGWTQSVLYTFTGGSDSIEPLSGVIFKEGKLFGAASGGLSPGAIFELTPPSTKAGTWTETTLHTFAGGTDGAYPDGGVIFVGESLYGNTAGGGRGTCSVNELPGCGVVFRVIP